MTSQKILALPQRSMCPPSVAWNVVGVKRSSFYMIVNAGLLPPGVPVSFGGRTKAWPLHELLRVNAARAAGADDTAIRAVVSEIVADRKTGSPA